MHHPKAAEMAFKLLSRSFVELQKRELSRGTSLHSHTWQNLQEAFSFPLLFMIVLVDARCGSDYDLCRAS